MPHLRSAVALAMITLTACIDGTGPRPRPGATDDTQPPPTTDPVHVLWAELQPRVITFGVTDTLILTVQLSGVPNRASLLLRTGPLLQLQRVSATLYTTKVPANLALFGYRIGDLHQAVGLIDVSSGGGTSEMVLMANVKDNTSPISGFTSHSPTMQSSDHVVNIRHDAILRGAPAPASVMRGFYELFPDEYDFIAVLESVQSDNSTFYTAVQNQTTGIGSSIFNNASAYGSNGRLQGVVQYPVDAHFDLARTDNIHEIAHRWMNHLAHPLVNAARPHWPISTLAFGIMGLAGNTTSEWMPFPFDVVRQQDGTHVLRTTDAPRSFNDMELYLMGLLPADSVRVHVVFADQNQRPQVRPNGVLRGRVDSLTIASVIAQAGVRVPSAASAQRDFRMATIVLSRNGLLSRDELGFFDHLAARGELRVTVPFTDGVTRGNTLPFFLATGGRATLTTRLRRSQQPL